MPACAADPIEPVIVLMLENHALTALPLPAGRAFVAAVEDAGESPDSMNENQKALIAFSRYLDSRVVEDPATKVQRYLAMMEGTQTQFRAASDRVRLFLDQQKQKIGVR